MKNDKAIALIDTKRDLTIRPIETEPKTTRLRQRRFPGSELEYDYTEFDGFPPEYYSAKKAKGHDIPRTLTPDIKARLEKRLSEDHQHIAKFALSSEHKRPTLLLNSGQVIQVAADVGAVFVSSNVDRKTIGVLMALDVAAGRSIKPADQTFGDTTNQVFRDRFMKLWTEEYDRRQPKVKAVAEVTPKRLAQPTRALIRA